MTNEIAAVRQPRIIRVKPQKKEFQKIVIYTSGAPRKEFGNCYWQFIAIGDEKTIIRKSNFTDAKKVTHVVAQFIAIIEALNWVAHNYPNQSVEIVNSYDTAVDILNGKKKRRAKHLKFYYDTAKAIQANTKASFTWMLKNKMSKTN
jgi:ribonuclease HI